MNVLVSTIGKYLEVGANLIELMKERMSFDKIGFAVSDSLFFKDFIARNSFIQDHNVLLLKEWEFTSIPGHARPNWESIASYEKTLADPTFWNALMADRRIFFGRYCKSKQHYRPRFSYEELMLILEQALEQIEAFFNRLSPHLVFSFGTATMADYLIYLFARSRNIPYLQLKATKVKNYVALYDTPLGLSSDIVEAYRRPDPLPDDVMRDVRSHITDVSERGLRYEGAILSSRSRLMKRLGGGPLKLLRSFVGSIIIHCDRTIREDCHVPGIFVPSLYFHVLQPLKSFGIESRLKRHPKFLDRNNLPGLRNFFFFPLHFEPEVSLQVFGRRYQNQIELVRNVALSSPVGTKVLVKEHPRSLGFRPFSYYRKLLEIPNVYLVDPFIKAHEIVRFARLVAVITGSIGLEAAITRRPVITFGEAAYNIFPDSMVCHVTNLNMLCVQIRDLLDNYRYNNEAIEKYIGAFIQRSVSLDLYSLLLSKVNRYSEDGGSIEKETRLAVGYERLAEYCIRRFKEVVPSVRQ
ncbi:MAG: capsular polysaccharide export protein, LipB/KpsS family [Planctomycetota bacterium]|jgi:hypothetical protein